MDELIDSSHFIDDQYKEKCKEYFRQIPKAEVAWIYSSALPIDTYQGDIVDKFEIVFHEVSGDSLEIRVLEDVPCMLLSNTCDMEPEGKTRKKHISFAPVFSFSEFANSRTDQYSEEGWNDYLKRVKANKVTDILFIPGYGSFGDSVVLLDRIYSTDPELLKIKIEKGATKRIASLSQIGFYFFLIKLTYHFARYEDRDEIVRD